MKDCYSHCSGAGLETKPESFTSEHQKVRSRLTGEKVEISFGPMPAASDPSKGGNIPANPFMSLKQSHFAHAHPEKFGGAKGLKEWDKETTYETLPKKVKK